MQDQRMVCLIIFTLVFTMIVIGFNIKIYESFATLDSPTLTTDVTRDANLIMTPDLPDNLFGSNNQDRDGSDSTLESIRGAFKDPAQEDDQSGNEIVTNKSGFKKLTNSEYGFEFIFPSNWITVRLGSPPIMEGSPINVVRMGSPSSIAGLDGVDDMLSIDVIKPSRYLDTDAMEVRTSFLTPHEYAKIATDSFSEYGIDLVRENPTIVSGLPAYRIEYLAPLSYDTEVFVSDHERNLYDITFTTPALNAPETLPIFSKILESFRFISPLHNMNYTESNSSVQSTLQSLTNNTELNSTINNQSLQLSTNSTLS
jgi:hypothetical protein